MIGILYRATNSQIQDSVEKRSEFVVSYIGARGATVKCQNTFRYVVAMK
jgi:hypothetical protein